MRFRFIVKVMIRVSVKRKGEFKGLVRIKTWVRVRLSASSRLGFGKGYCKD